MPVTGLDTLRKERINEWTNQIKPDQKPFGCEAFPSLDCMGSTEAGPTEAPRAYMADSLDGMIVVDPSKGYDAIWVNENCSPTMKY